MRKATKRLLSVKDFHWYSHKANEEMYFNLLDFDLKAARWIHRHKNDSGWMRTVPNSTRVTGKR